MNELYPPIEPTAMRWIDVENDHKIYLEECGNPAGESVLFIHGGPGSGCSTGHRRYFDPAHYRIVLVDQRGCGRSTPLGETAGNCTDWLVQDFEAVRQRLGIERWILFGGSWGATLALCYARAFPSAVSAMILRGTFLARSRDLDWFFGPFGAASVFPDAYERFTDGVPPEERCDLIAAYHRRVHGADAPTAGAWASAWAAWGDRVATWTLGSSGEPGTSDSNRLLAKVRIETHFAVNRYFLADRPLLGALDQLPDVPITIVQGRRDLVCPVDAAWALYRAIPGARLILLPDTGHLVGEPAMIDALVGETDRLRRG